MRPYLAITFIIIGCAMFACAVAASDAPALQSVLLLCGGTITLAIGLQFLRYSQT